MGKVISLEELAGLVSSGMRLGIGGVHFARLPLRLIETILRLRRRDFTFISWGGGLALELFLEAGAVKKLAFCFSSLDIFGLAPRFRQVLESQHVEVEEWTALAMIQGLQAAKYNLPEFPFQIPVGSDLMSQGSFWRQTASPFTGEKVGQARRLDLDVLLLHAQRADSQGNLEIQGARGLDLSLLGAARKTLVTVEEIVGVGEVGRAERSFALPHSFVTAVACVPMGAYPTSCLPYYTTDYQRLLAYARAEQQRRRAEKSAAKSGEGGEGRETRTSVSHGRRFDCPEPRQKFLRAAASVSVSSLTPSRLRRHGLETDEEADYSIDELMAVCLAREYTSGSVCSVGSVSPLALVSYLLAKRTFAPGLMLIAFNGGFIDVEAHPISITLAETLDWQTAKVHWGGDETYQWYYQSGRISHEVITVAQVDVHGQTNNAWIRGPSKRLRLPGQGGMADVANLHQHFLLYLTRHSPDRFVETVDFSTAARGLLSDDQRIQAGLRPGTVRLVSNLGIFELDHKERLFCLLSLHPNVTLEEVRRQTGGEFVVAESVGATEPPSKEQLRLIRQEIDPFGTRRLEFVPAKERLATIESILHAEEAMVGEIIED